MSTGRSFWQSKDGCRGFEAIRRTPRLCYKCIPQPLDWCQAQFSHMFAVNIKGDSTVGSRHCEIAEQKRSTVHTSSWSCMTTTLQKKVPGQRFLRTSARPVISVVSARPFSQRYRRRDVRQEKLTILILRSSRCIKMELLHGYVCVLKSYTAVPYLFCLIVQPFQTVKSPSMPQVPLPRR